MIAACRVRLSGVLTARHDRISRPILNHRNHSSPDQSTTYLSFVNCKTCTLYETVHNVLFERSYPKEDLATLYTIPLTFELLSGQETALNSKFEEDVGRERRWGGRRGELLRRRRS